MGIVPRHEELIGAVGVAENFGPSAGCFVAIRIPERAERWVEGVAMRLQIARQLYGNRRRKGAIRSGGVVARVAQHADFIFDLHHEHGVIAAISFFDVLHRERQKRARRLLA